MSGSGVRLLVTTPEAMSDTTYLVTGGAGFIGSALVRALIEQRAGNVVNIDKLDLGRQPRFTRPLDLSETTHRLNVVEGSLGGRI